MGKTSSGVAEVSPETVFDIEPVVVEAVPVAPLAVPVVRVPPALLPGRLVALG